MNEKLNKLVEGYLNLRNEIKKLNEDLEELKAKIKIEMNIEDIDKYVDNNGNQVTYKESVRKSLNRKLVEEKLAPEIFRECLKESKFETLRVLSKEELERVKKMTEDKKKWKIKNKIQLKQWC